MKGNDSRSLQGLPQMSKKIAESLFSLIFFCIILSQIAPMEADLRVGAYSRGLNQRKMLSLVFTIVFLALT